MSRQLSRRLAALAALAGTGEVLADIGCDHAYLSIALVESGVYARAIACDLREGPLRAAREHIAQAGLERQIECRCADGLMGLRTGEADTLLCAGMGGALMREILSRGAEVAGAARRLVLQPQSEVAQLRRWLRENAYRIEAEEIVCEDGKYYPMMTVTPGAGSAEESDGREELPQALADAYGGVLIARRHPVLRAYLERELALAERDIAALRSGAAEAAGAEGAETVRAAAAEGAETVRTAAAEGAEAAAGDAAGRMETAEARRRARLRELEAQRALAQEAYRRIGGTG